MCIHQPCAFQVQLAVHILQAVTILGAHRVASYTQRSYVFMQAGNIKTTMVLWGSAAPMRITRQISSPYCHLNLKLRVALQTKIALEK